MIELTKQNIDDYSFPDIFVDKSILSDQSFEFHFPEYFHVDRMIEKPCVLKVIFGTKPYISFDDVNEIEIKELGDYVDLIFDMKFVNKEFLMQASVPRKGVFLLKCDQAKVYFEDGIGTMYT